MKQGKKKNWMILIGDYKFIIPFFIILFLGEFIFFQWFYQDIIFLNRCYKSSQCNDIQRLMAIYDKTIETGSFSKDIKIPYCLFLVLLHSGKTSEAVNVLEKIVTAHPQEKMLIFQLAIELFNLERYNESEKYLRLLLDNNAHSKTNGEA